MKILATLLLTLSISQMVHANGNQAAYIKLISNYINENSNDFFTYRAKGEKAEDTKYVAIKKDPKTNLPDFSIVPGGSYPAGTILPSMGKPVSYIKGLFYFTPKDSYEIETISINFTDSVGQKQAVVCVITDYTLCGEAQISSCAMTEGGKGDTKKGYSASSLQRSFIYNSDLHQKCEDKKNEVNNSRLKGKIIDPVPATVSPAKTISK